jgi:hypothetical protein
MFRITQIKERISILTIGTMTTEIMTDNTIIQTGMTTEIMTENTIIQVYTMRRGLTTVLIVINMNSHQIILT